MKAFAIDKNGACGVIDAPKPQLKKGQVLIEVKAVSLSRGDYASRGDVSLHAGPIDARSVSIIGSDVAGVVVDAAPGAASFKPGDRVCAACKGLAGGAAEFAVADAKWTAHIPAAMSFSKAAAIPSAGVTALAAIKKIEPAAGKRIAVCGASGGVGQYATMFARQAGAAVDAACGAAHSDVPKSCGAMKTFDYAAGLSAFPGDAYDAVIAVNGSFSASDYAHLLKRGGAYIAVGMDSIRPALAMVPKGRRVKFALFFAEISKGGLAEAVGRVASSPFSIAISEHRGLDCVPEALFELTEMRTGAKQVVLI